jgi:hypothetical protein
MRVISPGSRQGPNRRRLRPDAVCTLHSARKALHLRTRLRAASGDDVAHPLGRAVLGIKGGGPLGQLPQLATQLLELPDPHVQVGGMALQQVGDMRAGVSAHCRGRR